MILRTGTTADADAIAHLIASFHRELTDNPSGEGADRYFASVSVQAEREYLASARYRYLVAEQAGRMLGFIALRDLGHVFHLFVDRSMQRTGVARSLWNEARLRLPEVATPDGFTVNSSLRAVPVYEAFGFERTAEPVSMHGISFVPMRLAASRMSK